MEEAYIRLLCPGCVKGWESTPTSLPAHDRRFQCPNCNTRRRLAEFMRTEYDLRTLKQLG